MLTFFFHRFKENFSVPLPDRPCIDANECEDLIAACPSGFNCINTYGGFYCQRDLTALYIVLPVFFVLLVLAIILFFLLGWFARKAKAQYLNDLPDEVSWTWRQAIMEPDGWLPSGGFLSKQFDEGSEEFNR